MKTQHFILALILLFYSNVRAGENDSLPYKMFKKDVILALDFGFYSAPFSIKSNYDLGVKKLKYRNNPKLALGIGLSYKWLSFRFAFALPIDLLPTHKFNKTKYYDLGIRFNLKKTFTAIELRNYKGFVIKDAYNWNDSIEKDIGPNQFRTNTTSTSISANVWYFKDEKFKYQAAIGMVGHYNDAGQTWYFKSTLNFFGISNETKSLVPAVLTDSSDLMNATSLGAIDLGFIPGYAYVNRIKNWQFSALAGLGGVIQAKYYVHNGYTKSNLGIAPRIDLRLMVGYSRPGYFILLSSNFDIKSVKIQDLDYNQSYYNVRLTSGFRIKTKESKKKIKEKEIRTRELTSSNVNL